MRALGDFSLDSQVAFLFLRRQFAPTAFLIFISVSPSLIPILVPIPPRRRLSPVVARISISSTYGTSRASISSRRSRSRAFSLFRSTTRSSSVSRSRSRRRRVSTSRSSSLSFRMTSRSSSSSSLLRSTSRSFSLFRSTPRPFLFLSVARLRSFSLSFLLSLSRRRRRCAFLRGSDGFGRFDDFFLVFLVFFYFDRFFFVQCLTFIFLGLRIPDCSP